METMPPDLHSNRAFTHRFAWAALAVLGAGIALAAWRVGVEDRHLRDDLLQQVTLLSWAIQATEADSLSGSPADLSRVTYQRLKEQLARSREIHPHSRFLYLMRTNSTGQVIFLADSEPPGSQQYSPPGQLYEEATPTLLKVFAGHPQVEGPVSDRWGTWVSALVPLYHPYDGRMVAVLGMDVEAREWRATIAKPIRSTIVYTLLLLMALATGYQLFTALPDRTKVASGWRRPEVILSLMLGLGLTAVATLLARKQADHRQQQAFYRTAIAQASLVQQAMFRLGDNYLEGLSRLFTSSDFVNRKEFNSFVGYLINRPYAQAWMWIPVVLDAELAMFESAVKQGGAPGFFIKETGPGREVTRASPRPLYYPICYLEPDRDQPLALGLDQGADPVRREALESAAYTRLTTATDPLRLGPHGRDTDILVCRAVFDQHDPSRLVGYTAIALDTGLFLQRVLSRESTRDEPVNQVALYQLQASQPARWMAALQAYPGSPTPFAPVNLLNRAHPLRMIAPVFAFGKVYALGFEPGPLFHALYPNRAARTVAAGGLVLTALTSLLVALMTGWRVTLEKQVADRTAELRSSESSYHGLFNAIQQAIYILDERGTFIDVNDGALAMYGYSRNELIGRNPATVSAPQRNNMTDTALRLEKAYHGEPQYFEFWGQRKNGDIFPKDVWLYPGLYFGRQVVVAVANDISERKHSERELRDTHERLNSFIEAIPDTVQIKDGEGRWQLINRAAARLFQVEHTAWHNKSDAQLAEERPHLSGLHEACAFSDQAAWAHTEASTFAESMPTPRGTRMFEVLKLPLYEADGRRKALIAIGRDVTERNQAEEDKDRLQAQLQQAQKLESIGRLAGGVAHDFNNMLQAILGNAALALDESPSGPLSEYLLEIKRSAQRSADLTRQLLAFASRQTVKPRVIDLNDTVAGMLKMLRRLIGEDIQLLWSPGVALWPIKVDPSQMDQILANLSVNARDAIDGVGTITIETANRTLTPNDPMITSFPGARPGDHAVLTVRDTGKGMDEEIRRHIFEPFYTTKAAGKGVGLGLATVFGIVKQNRGFISVQSEPGLGATFVIGLPRTHLSPSEETEGSSTQTVRGGNETILLVEDEQAILRFGQEGLTRLGYKVLVAPTPEEALVVAKNAGAGLSLLVTDVVLPNMNGRELAQRLMRQITGLKCLFMSGYTADIIAHRGVLDDTVNFIQKPFTLESLATKIRAALDRT